MQYTVVNIWGQDIPANILTPEQQEYLLSLPKAVPNIQWVWDEMNRVWYDLCLDNTRMLAAQCEATAQFYSHPIWLVNGLFTACDATSRHHRQFIAEEMDRIGANNVADYGGGFGELALALARSAENRSVTVIEPYPSRVGLYRLERQSNVRIASSLEGSSFDAIVAQDVLEHVDDPIGLAYHIASHVQQDGYIFFANCFYPMIACHLPPTFHLRYTFELVMRAMGLTDLGKVEGAPHARVFAVRGKLNLNAARRAESISRLLGSSVNFFINSIGHIRRRRFSLKALW